jgi:hypothetical protein
VGVSPITKRNMKFLLLFLPVLGGILFRKKGKSDHDLIVEDMNEFLSKFIGVIEENSANGTEQDYIRQMNTAMKNYNAPREFKIKMYGLIMSNEAAAMSFFKTLARD